MNKTEFVVGGPELKKRSSAFPSSFHHVPQVGQKVSVNFSHKLKDIRNPTYFNTNQLNIYFKFPFHQEPGGLLQHQGKRQGICSSMSTIHMSKPAETSIIQPGPQGLIIISPNKMALRCHTTLWQECSAPFSDPCLPGLIDQSLLLSAVASSQNSAYKAVSKGPVQSSSDDGLLHLSSLSFQLQKYFSVLYGVGEILSARKHFLYILTFL